MTEPIIELGFLTIEQASDYIKMSIPTIKRHVSSGALKAYKPGRRLLFRKEDIDKWVKSKPAA